ncbi:MAG: MHS family MFS transporter [Proteobacteria bacterium]|nr:MHS family MFS transporter [Pseudomonadota bacterium]
MVAAPAFVPTPVSINRLALLGLAAASIEWYDFFLYGVGAALIFPTLFFPTTLPHSVALLASFSTFAVGFVARPVGALAFGHIGDRIGRKSALAVAMVLMGAATTLIACLPSYAAIGVAAPIVLVLLRFLQGLAIGGQWGGAMLLLVESAPQGRRGFYGSVAQAGVPVGVVSANLAFLAVSACTTAEEFAAWGWRIPFVLSVALVGLGIFLHRRIEDTPVYRELLRRRGDAHRPRGSPVLQALREHPREIFQGIGAHIAVNLCFYICITYSIAYGTDVAGLHLPRTLLLSAVIIASVTMAPLLLIGGALSDRFGRRRIYMLGAVLTGISAFFLFALIDKGSLPWVAAGIAGTMGASSLMYGPQAALFGELFRTHVRYSGASVAYQTAAILGGGFAPIVATELTAHFHSTFAVSCYMALACVIAFIAVASMPETSSSEL